MKSSDDTGTPEDLEQLLRLRQVQVDKAEERLRLSRRERDQASQAVDAAVRKVQDDVANAKQFADYMVGEGATELAKLGTWFAGYRTHLNNTLTRSQADLVRDRGELEKREAALSEMHAAWFREMARRDGVESALKRSRAAEVRETERLAEQEIEELQRPQVPRRASGTAPHQPARSA
jgi:flagellar biosynthesis chaperone FliJ